MTCHSFYCSRCKKDHPGECAPASAVKGDLPALGSLWLKQVGDASVRSGWRTGGIFFEVVSVVGGTVTYVVQGDTYEWKRPSEAWTNPIGYVAEGGWRVRFVPA